MKLDKTLVFLIIMHIALVVKVAERKKKKRRIPSTSRDLFRGMKILLRIGKRLTSKGIHHSVAPDVRLVAYARSSRFYKAQSSRIAGKMKKFRRPDNPATKGCYTLQEKRKRVGEKEKEN